jgi:hypothetical protein
MLHKKMKKISQIVKNTGFKVAFGLVSGSHQWCDPGYVRFFSIFFMQQWGELSPAPRLDVNPLKMKQ